MRRAAVAAVACALLVVACGESEEDEVRETVTRFRDALAAGDSDRLCDTMSPELFSLAPCDETILLFARAEKYSGEVQSVEVDDDSAVAELERGTVELQQVDGEWKVAQLP